MTTASISFESIRACFGLFDSLSTVDLKKCRASDRQ
jgi:hypothetical protein